MVRPEHILDYYDFWTTIPFYNPQNLGTWQNCVLHWQPFTHNFEKHLVVVNRCAISSRNALSNFSVGFLDHLCCQLNRIILSGLELEPTKAMYCSHLLCAMHLSCQSMVWLELLTSMETHRWFRLQQPTQCFVNSLKVIRRNAHCCDNGVCLSIPLKQKRTIEELQDPTCRP